MGEVYRKYQKNREQRQKNELGKKKYLNLKNIKEGIEGRGTGEGEKIKGKQNIL